MCMCVSTLRNLPASSLVAPAHFTGSAPLQTEIITLAVEVHTIIIIRRVLFATGAPATRTYTYLYAPGDAYNKGAIKVQLFSLFCSFSRGQARLLSRKYTERNVAWPRVARFNGKYVYLRLHSRRLRMAAVFRFPV